MVSRRSFFNPRIERAYSQADGSNERSQGFPAIRAAYGLPLTDVVKSVVLVACVTIGFAGDAYAQTERISFSAAQPYSATDRLFPDMYAIPDNIFAEPEYRALLETILARSSTFRRQCLRIGNEPALAVYVRRTPVRLTDGVRATTEISRQSESRIVARVMLHPFDNTIEMIAHEFEHIIEQLDDVNLAAKARRARSGVHAIYGAGTTFETTRALRVGLRVVQEFRHSRGRGSSPS